MNLDQYRAMKAQEQEDTTQTEVQPNAQTEQVPTEPVQPGVQETPQNEPTPPSTGTETPAQNEPSADPTPQFFEINGEQVSLEELQKGYLRQSDYTRKTQEVSRKQREIQQAQALFEQLNQNPEVAQQIGYNPQEASYQALQDELADLRLQQEITTLSTKYPDFNADAVIDFAVARNLPNLEDAYLLNKQYSQFTQPPATPVVPQQQPQAIDVEALKAQLRAELQAEMNTSTIINGSGTAPTTQADVVLTDAERRVARGMGMSDAEYAKWR
jgi:phage I-like protein